MRASLISTLFAYREASVPLREWLAALQKAALGAAFRDEPLPADERGNFRDLLEASKKGASWRTIPSKSLELRAGAPNNLI